MREVGNLSRLHETYFADGFRVVAVSIEPAGVLESSVVGEAGAKYWIGSDPEQATMRNFVEQGLLTTPRYYLVDARGEVVGEELPSEERIEDLLAGMFELELGRDMHERLQEARTAYEARCYGVAWEKAGRFVKDPNDELAADARLLRERVEGYAEHRKSLLVDARAFLPAPRTYGELLTIAKRFDGVEAARWARTELKKLEPEDEVRAERAAWSAFGKALERELAGEGRSWKIEAARSAYERVVKKFEGTQAATLAQEALDALPPG